MSTDRDVNRIVRSWMDEGVTQLPDRVLDAVLDQLPATPQRRSGWLARRSLLMSNPARIGLAAAAVVVLAILGYQLFIAPNIGGPAPTPSPTVSEPVASPMPSTSPVAFPVGVELTPGTYVLNTFPVDVTFEVGRGWYAGMSTPSTAILLAPPGVEDGRVLGFFVVDNVYADPCDSVLGELDPPVGPSIDELVSALSNTQGFQATPPIDATVGSFQGKEFVLTAAESGLGCPNLLAWRADEHRRDFGPGETGRLLVVDADGVRLLINTMTPAQADAAIQAEVESALDSLRVQGP